MAYYSNRLSYQEVENLVERVTGQRILSDQKIWEIVINQAGEISAQWQEQINKINSLMTKEIEISPTVDIYNSEQEEILLFDDGIGVKKQKDNRERNHSPTSERALLKETEISEVKKSRKNIITDLVLLETAKGRFEYITSPINRSGQSVFP